MRLRNATPFVFLFLIFLYSPLTYSMTKLYFECDKCSVSQMQVKATSKWIIGDQAEAHVFNETDKLYKKYWVYKEVVTNESLIEEGEAFTKISASPRQPNETIKQAFESYIDSKRALVENIKDISVKLVSNDSVVLQQYASRNYTETTTQKNSDSSILECKSREVSGSERTAHDYIMSHYARTDLFNSITEEFNASGVGNMPEFIAKHDKLFNALEATGIPIVSQAGHTLSVIGRGSNAIEVLTADNGRMYVELNFKRKTAKIDEAFDGDCNQIPTAPTDNIVGEFRFSTVSGATRMENLIMGYGASITGSHNWLSCELTGTSCWIHSNGQKSCSRKCLKWKRH